MNAANPSSAPVSVSTWQKNSPTAELIDLISYLPKPALIVDKVRGTVFGANHEFYITSAFDPSEISGINISLILGGVSVAELLLAETQTLRLERRMREGIMVSVQARSLDGTGQYCLVQLTPIDAESEDSEAIQAGVFSAQEQLTRLPQDEKPEDSFQLAAEIIREALHAEFCVIYQASPDDPNFRIVCASGSDPGLPSVFPPTDMAKLSAFTLWQQGKRMQVELHRAGRITGQNYIATVPLGQAGMLVGVLVVGSSKPPLEKLDGYLTLFGAQVTRIIDHHLILTELQRQIQENSSALLISNVGNGNMDEGVLVVSPEMNIVSINPAAEWMLGYAEWEVAGYPIDNVLIGPDSLQPALTAAEKGLPTHTIGNVSLHRRNGQLFPAHIQIIPIGEGGPGSSMVVFVRDISENEEIRQKTQQLEQRAVLGEVTAVFAHEVRNPINNIYTGLQVLMASLAEDSSQRADVGRLLGDCNRLNHLMESVLNFSRNNIYTFEKVDLQMLIGRILDRWRPRFNNVNVSAFFSAEEGTPHVAGDMRALDQVFQNLVRNAVEAMEAKGGNLAIRMEPVFSIPNRPQVLITVSDDGPGIAEEIRERIFEPFVTTKSQGTGLGLAIIKRIITAHHGSILVNSFPGGTMFEITLLAYRDED